MTTETIEVTGVHPLAAQFPKLSKPQLAELAKDIAHNGLRYPIVVNSDGLLIDGRNRLEACKIAKVEPEFVVDDDDPVSIIVSQNMMRRNMTAGQVAIIAAAAELGVKLSADKPASDSHESPVGDSPIGWRDGASSNAWRRVKGACSLTRVTEAVMIVRYAPDLARDVLYEGGEFQAAHQTASKRQKEGLTREQRLSILEDNAVDLAEEVREERLALNDAYAAYEQRQRDEIQVQTITTRSVGEGVMPAAEKGKKMGGTWKPLPARELKKHAEDTVANYVDKYAVREPVTPAAIACAIAYLTALKTAFEARKEA